MKAKTIEEVLRDVLATDVSRVDPVPEALAAIEELMLERVIWTTTRNDKDIGAMSSTAKRTRGNRNQLRREQEEALKQVLRGEE